MKKFIIVICSTVLFAIPFFWLKPGEMDLGGDNTRLYFYDPLKYILSTSLWSVSPSGLGGEVSTYFTLPYVLFLALLKSLVVTPTNLIMLHHGLMLATAFVGVFLFTRKLLRISGWGDVAFLPAITAGVFYTLSPPFLHGWDKAMMVNNQLFLNPLMSYLFLLILESGKPILYVAVLTVTFIFSPNFDYNSIPRLLAFYPLTISFLLLHRIFILKKSVPWFRLASLLLLLILVHAFHIIPPILSIFKPGSDIHTAMFTKQGQLIRGLDYFISIAPSVKTTMNILGLQQGSVDGLLNYAYIVFPVLLICALIIQRKEHNLSKRRTFLLILFFFFITVYFATAHISEIGFKMYMKLFTIPGFSMFRNFYGQWQYVFIFMYTTLLALSLSVIAEKLSRKQILPVLSIIIICVISINAIPFIKGEWTINTLWQSNMKTKIKFDPSFKEILQSVINLPDDGKMLTLPLTDPAYQILAGRDNTAYQGPSIFSYITGRQDFSGYEAFGAFKDSILRAAALEDKNIINRYLGLLGIRYVFHNSDPAVYDAFPGFPYEHVRNFLPLTQSGYVGYLASLGVNKIVDQGDNYHLYSLDSEYALPVISAIHGPVVNIKPTLNDIYLPIRLFTQPDYKLFFFRNDDPPQTDTSVIIADSRLRIDDTIINPGVPIYVERPFAKVLPGSFSYQFVQMKEKNDIEKMKPDTEEWMKRVLYYASKRVTELEYFGEKLTFSDGGADSTNKKNDKQMSYPVTAWESKFEYINSVFTDISKYIEKSTDPYWKIKQKLFVNEYMSDFQKRIANGIKLMRLPYDKKIKLDEYADTMFDEIGKRLAVKNPDYTELVYSLPDRVSSGSYDPYIEIQPRPYPVTTSLTIDGKEIEENFNQEKKGWLQLDPVKLSENESLIEPVITITGYKNLVKQEEVKSIEVGNEDGMTVISFVPELANARGYLWKINDWKPEHYYAISFDYTTEGVPMNVSVVQSWETKSGSNNTIYLFNHYLKSRTWQKFETIVKSPSLPIPGYFMIVRDDALTNGSLKLKNLTIHDVNIPQAVFVKSDSESQNLRALNISYEKINPAQYRVQIPPFSKAFYLILSQQYNRDWKVYPFGKGRISEDKTRYMNQSIYTVISQSVQLIVSTIGKKTIAETSHYSVNGYANAWYITPQDISPDGETIVIQSSSQGFFYISLALGCLILCLVTVWAVISGIKTIRRYRTR